MRVQGGALRTVPRPDNRMDDMSTAWARIGVVCLLLLGLAGCGFRPLYGSYAFDRATVAELAQIRVDLLGDRQGQLLHNALLARLNPRGEPVQARYTLSVQYGASEAQSALRKDDTATRDTLTFNVRYQLVQGETVITAGNFSRQLSYDYLPEHYSNVTADADMRRRAADLLAEEIRNQLAAYFTRRAASARQP